MDNEPSPPSPSSTDLSAACAAAEEAFRHGHIARSRKEAEGLLAAARAEGDRASEARLLQLLAEVDYDELVYPRSLERLEAALVIRAELFGDEDVATRYTRACRAVVLVGEGRPDEADVDLARALAPVALPASPADAAVNARFWVALGSALAARDRDAEASRIFEALLAVEREGTPFDPLALANALLHYSAILEGTGDSERALALAHRMIELRRGVIGVPSLRVALGLVGLGTSQLRLGRLDEARATLLDAMAMLRETGHEEHPRASLICLGLAVAEIIGGRGPSSERWITRAVELETRTFGGSHPSTATMYLTAAKMFSMRGHHSRAADLAQRAAAALVPRALIRTELLDEAISIGYSSLHQLKKNDAIARWLEPLIESLEKISPDVPSLPPALNMLGEAYAADGKLRRAEAVLRRSMKLAERVHGAESEPMQVLYTNLAELLRRQKRLIEADDATRRAAQIAEIVEAQRFSPMARRWRRGLS